MTHPRPHSLTDEQLQTLLTVTGALAPRHRCWIPTAVLSELTATHDVQEAINKSLKRLMREQVPA